MAHGDVESVKRFTRTAIYVFVGLLVLTVVTVGVSYVPWLHEHHSLAIAVALIIAAIKASMVALWFMHLISERQMIYSLLILAAIFFVVLVAIPMFQFFNGITI